MIVGLLHPGRMGAAIGARLTTAGHTVLWCPTGRSPASAERARTAALAPVDDLTELTARATTIVSICPAHVAVSLAETVAQHGFTGLYIDANATNPTTMRSIRAAFDDSSDVIDAVISGPPPTAETGPRIHLAGPAPAAARAYDLFISAGLTTTNLGERLGAASALKMATASYLRTTRLLAALAHGLADAHGVTDALIAEAHELGAKPLADRGYLPSVAARAWRWQQEMVDVADTLTDADLPAGLAAASAQLFECLAAEKDNFSIAPEAVIARLRTPTAPN
ncbi:phosphogluconate dehydrogenase [Nocardia sp. FDAARGOS_372]|uniref:NAD(P)-dependent oxidoreductase n=1 Tax=Nocardia TaxID=1817 RepID=UPI000BF1130E|nr:MULTISPECIES: NAD(P)-dependent oxidoreductase [Nocardia]MBF6314037.1 DUF1932 domain-containing protein [Nocardia farcinica]PEH76436.1 phosphogluconate dehydrogenase [Nocardia sp. FDAARGOS_372]UEX20795.1 DUF1932 domain-containing protein [Nocardia farcinica]